MFFNNGVLYVMTPQMAKKPRKKSDFFNKGEIDNFEEIISSSPLPEKLTCFLEIQSPNLRVEEHINNTVRTVQSCTDVNADCLSVRLPCSASPNRCAAVQLANCCKSIAVSTSKPEYDFLYPDSVSRSSILSEQNVNQSINGSDSAFLFDNSYSCNELENISSNVQLPSPITNEVNSTFDKNYHLLRKSAELIKCSLVNDKTTKNTSLFNAPEMQCQMCPNLCLSMSTNCFPPSTSLNTLNASTLAYHDDVTASKLHSIDLHLDASSNTTLKFSNSLNSSLQNQKKYDYSQSLNHSLYSPRFSKICYYGKNGNNHIAAPYPTHSHFMTLAHPDFPSASMSTGTGSHKQNHSFNVTPNTVSRHECAQLSLHQQSEIVRSAFVPVEPKDVPRYAPSAHENSSCSDESCSPSPVQMTCDKKRIQTCRLCHNHGSETPIRGHKYFCPYKKCDCDNCKVTLNRRYFVKEQLRLTRQQLLTQKPRTKFRNTTLPIELNIEEQLISPVKMKPFPQKEQMMRDLEKLDCDDFYERITSICRPDMNLAESDSN